MDPYLMFWHSSWTYAIGCVLPEDDLRRKSKTVTIKTAQINKCWYDRIYFVLLNIIVIVALTAPFGKYAYLSILSPASSHLSLFIYLVNS
jgi:hypothetical protein